MIRITDKSECCGCSACYASCPYDAIRMDEDRLGFQYPVVDMDKCVDCRICERVCAFHPSDKKSQPESFAVRHKDIAEVLDSTSGAAFVAFSDYFLDNGGVVYGAAYEGHFRVVHKRAETAAERDSFRRSKYVQSDMGDVFRQVKADLKSGLKVLFTGTPCQVAGLKSYIGASLSENLYLADIVCHGVPSPEVWKQYVLWQEDKYGEKALSAEFRDKSFGWRSAVESFTFSKEKISSKSFNHLFYKHLTLRQSCGCCPYADVTRPADLTMADFWRKDKTCPDFAADQKGCSLVLCHTDKGREVLESAAGSLYIASVDLESCLQQNLVQSSALHPRRDDFEEDFVTGGMEYVLHKYGDQGWKYKVGSSVRTVYQAVRQTARKILGRR